MPTTDPNESANPYAPPTELGSMEPHFETGLLATRGARLSARVLDTLLLIGVLLPAILIASLAKPLDSHQATILGAGIVGTIGVLGLCGYQWYLLSTRGQTLGKKWMNIKIVKMDGTPVDFVSAVVVRNWIIVFISMIPWVGFLVSLVDILMIFGMERRCLHDLMAGTKVVPGSPW